MRKATTSWLKEAEEELDSAGILFEHGRKTVNDDEFASCYLSQTTIFAKIVKIFGR